MLWLIAIVCVLALYMGVFILQIKEETGEPRGTHRDMGGTRDTLHRLLSFPRLSHVITCYSHGKGIYEFSIIGTKPCE